MSAPAFDSTMDLDERPIPVLTRWGSSLVLVLGVHAVAFVGMLAWQVPMEAIAPPPAAVMLELAPLPEAPPPAEPMEPPPPTLESIVPEPEPPPEPIIEPIVEPEPPPPVPAEVALPEPPKPKPKPKEPPKPTPPKVVERPQPRPEAKAAPQATPTPAPPAPVAAAPAPGPTSATVSRNAMPSWQGLVLGHLERHKRYPRAAQARRQQGVAHVRFTLDRQGRVLSARLEKTSGHESLDEETVAMVERASPLPPPPPEMAQDRIELVVPVQFFLR
ncbi:energy transducer TonB [Azospirillum soli]|uniref:energy transducer TonB n=1 Tax=Azospirillum soli TaxID=1304799 RepID=UPI001AE6FBED|nr:TonB family protein [Azospirillum soli]MBP2311461.1 protein TonB [Azospirillum soli]